jgi:uncharacterized protein (TIGR02099 family)
VPGLIRKAWRFAAGLFAVIVILLAVFVGLVRVALVQVPEYRDQIEAWAGEALGWPVQIGGMDARLGLRGPELRFTNARVLTHERTQTLIVAATGTMKFSSLALLRGEPRPAGVSLEGVALRVERTEDGRWRLLGEDGPALGEGDGGVMRLEDLPAGRFQLENLALEFEDLRRGLGPWLFQLDTLDLQLAAGELSVAAAGTLPEELGAGVSLSLAVTGQDERGRPRDWSAAADFDALDMQAIGAAVGRPDLLPAAGIVAGRLAADAGRKGVNRVTGSLDARDLALPMPAGSDGEPAAEPYRELGAELDWTRTSQGWHARISELDVQRADRRWRSPALIAEFIAGDAGRRIEAQADLLHIEDLVPLSRWLPPATRALVEQLAPSGTLSEFSAQLVLPPDESLPPALRIETRFDDLAVHSGERTPGFSGFSGTAAGDAHSGTAQLSGRGAIIDMPWMFRAPLRVESADLELEWMRDEHGLQLLIPALEAANEGAAIDARVAVTIPADDSSPLLDIDGVARNISIAAVPRYLPVNVVPPTVVKWVDQALLGGQVDAARFEIRGPRRTFPYRDGSGMFKVTFDIADAELNFDPGWPHATGLAASVRFENEGLWAEVREARLLNLEAGPASVAFPDLKLGELRILGSARGEFAAFREFVFASDLLERILGRGLAPAEFRAGRAAAELDLSLPLRRMKDYRAKIDLRIVGGEVTTGFLGEPLQDLNGILQIDNTAVSGRDITATLGRPVIIDVLVDDEGAVRVEGRGRMDAPSLARLLRLPLDTWADGESDIFSVLRFPVPGSGQPLRLEVSSGLEGMAITLPEPIRKAAATTRKLRVGATFLEDDIVDSELTWDDSLNVAARMGLAGDERVFLPVPGGIAGGKPGIVFGGSVKQVALAEWFGIEMPSGLETGGIESSIAGGRLLVGTLDAPLLVVDDVLLEMSRESDRWVFDVDADKVAGRIEIPFSPYGTKPVVARLSRLRLGADAEAPVPAEEAQEATPPAEDAAPGRLHPARVPSLDVEIEEAHFGIVRLGSISASVLNVGDGIELIGLEGMGDGFMFQAEGRSRLSDTLDDSRLGIQVRSNDVGATLEFIGFKRSMDAREGRFDAEVTWPGGLRSDWLSAIGGDASISIRDGTLIGVEPGAGRMFGLLSLQALPRRLSLDFKDVFGEGTAFDRISGDFRFIEGNAYTENLVMRSPAANIGIVGRTGLVARDYDQTAVIGADMGKTLPVAGVVVGGPAVGAALYLLSEVLRKPLQSQLTYRITGPWDNPVIERVGAGNTGPLAPPREDDARRARQEEPR